MIGPADAFFEIQTREAPASHDGDAEDDPDLERSKSLLYLLSMGGIYADGDALRQRGHGRGWKKWPK